MLAADHRLTDSESFRRAVRAGRRTGSSVLAVHLLSADDLGRPGPTRVGVVVDRSVGNAVTRNQVKRRLRHLVRARLDQVPAGADLVVRAQPAAAGLTSAELGGELDRCLHRLLAAQSQPENL